MFVLIALAILVFSNWDKPKYGPVHGKIFCANEITFSRLKRNITLRRMLHSDSKTLSLTRPDRMESLSVEF